MTMIRTIAAGAIAGCATALLVHLALPKHGSGAALQTQGLEQPHAQEVHLDPRIEGILQRLGDLELAPTSRSSRPQEASVAALPEDLERRLAVLEAAAEEAAGLRANYMQLGRALRGDQEQWERERRDPKVLFEEAEATILNPGASEEEKQAAWSDLRDAEVWDDTVVQEMIRVGQDSESQAIRADVWRQADGRHARSLLLVGPLLDALARDPSASVRSEAAETLANYLDQPGVRNALESARDHDTSDKVREEAFKSLNDD